MTTILALGKVAVPAAGTPVLLTTALAAAYPTFALPPYSSVRKVVVRTHSGNSGKVYVGSSSMVVSTKVGLIAEMLTPASGSTDQVEIADEDDGIDLSTLAVDAETNGQGPLVTVYV